MSENSLIEYEKLEGTIARIWLSRPEAINAQNVDMLYQLNSAFDRAVTDEEVKCIILAARGKHFSAGHDMNEEVTNEAISEREVVGTWTSANWVDPEGYYAREKEIYEGFCKRWRNISKPTVAQVQGKAIAGALMLIWPMDFVVASDDATFQDNTVLIGLPGIEYFCHAWELGIRRAKEFLMTGEPISADEAKQIGMVNRVVPREQLEESALELARTLSNRPTFAMKMAKDLINATYDAQGFENVQRAAFNAHHLIHTNYRWLQDGHFGDMEFLNNFRNKSSKNSS